MVKLERKINRVLEILLKEGKNKFGKYDFKSR
jgi:hypothetical protein